MIRVCVVCLGNICRSPIGEAVFRHLVIDAGLGERIEVESAGTAGYHTGDAPDPRARAAGKRAGIHVGGRAQQFTAKDFARFDYVVAMDSSNLNDLRAIAPSPSAAKKVRLMRSYDPEAPANAPVPDPYYGGDDGFDHVLELCQSAALHLLREIREEHRL